MFVRHNQFAVRDMLGTIVAVWAACVWLPAIGKAGPALMQVYAQSGVLLGSTGESDDDQHDGAFAVGASAETSVAVEVPGYGVIGGFSESSAQARPGFLGVTARAEEQSTITGTLIIGFNGVCSSSASARFVLYDLIISPIEGEPSEDIFVSLNLHISGSQDAQGSLNGPLNFMPPTAAGGISHLIVSGHLGGVDFGGSRLYSKNNYGVEETTELGIFAGFGGDDMVTSPVINVPVGVPLTFDLAITAEATASTNIVSHGNAFAATSFLNALSFPTSGPVFNLPEGYTANSVSGGIVDNHFVVLGDFDFDNDVDGDDFLLWQRNPSIGDLADWEAYYGTVAPSPSAAATAVPEPASGLAFLSAITIWLFRRELVVASTS